MSDPLEGLPPEVAEDLVGRIKASVDRLREVAQTSEMAADEVRRFEEALALIRPKDTP